MSLKERGPEKLVLRKQIWPLFFVCVAKLRERKSAPFRFLENFSGLLRKSQKGSLPFLFSQKKNPHSATSTMWVRGAGTRKKRL